MKLTEKMIYDIFIRMKHEGIFKENALCEIQKTWSEALPDKDIVKSIWWTVYNAKLIY